MSPNLSSAKNVTPGITNVGKLNKILEKAV
jgi:hypothetical protein